MKELLSDFSDVSDTSTLANFVRKYGLTQKDHPDTFVVCTHEGAVNGSSVVVTHRWRDRCKTFQIRPDGNDIELEVKDQDGKIIHSASVSYLDKE